MAYDRLIGFFISPETNLDLLVFEEGKFYHDLQIDNCFTKITGLMTENLQRGRIGTAKYFSDLLFNFFTF
ncbi:hypothetical protein IRB23M11_12970 [Alkalibacterium sp. m-11]